MLPIFFFCFLLRLSCSEASFSRDHLWRPILWVSVCRMGFVTQDDVMFPMLTVRESLLFAALLRLPNSMTRIQKIQRADTVLKELGLERWLTQTHHFSWWRQHWVVDRFSSCCYCSCCWAKEEEEEEKGCVFFAVECKNYSCEFVYVFWRLLALSSGARTRLLEERLWGVFLEERESAQALGMRFLWILLFCIWMNPLLALILPLLCASWKCCKKCSGTST